MVLVCSELPGQMRLEVIEEPDDGVNKVYIQHSSQHLAPEGVVLLLDAYASASRPGLSSKGQAAYGEMLQSIAANEFEAVHVEVNFKDLKPETLSDYSDEMLPDPIENTNQLPPPPNGNSNELPPAPTGEPIRLPAPPNGEPIRLPPPPPGAPN